MASAAASVFSVAAINANRITLCNQMLGLESESFSCSFDSRGDASCSPLGSVFESLGLNIRRAFASALLFSLLWLSWFNRNHLLFHRLFFGVSTSFLDPHGTFLG